jgi:septin family protein
MDEIEQQINEMVERYVEQIRPFTDRIAQLEVSLVQERKDKNAWLTKYQERVGELEASNKKLKEAIEELIAYGVPKHIEEGLYKALEE